MHIAHLKYPLFKLAAGTRWPTLIDDSEKAHPPDALTKTLSSLGLLGLLGPEGSKSNSGQASVHMYWSVGAASHAHHHACTHATQVRESVFILRKLRMYLENVSTRASPLLRLNAAIKWCGSNSSSCILARSSSAHSWLQLTIPRHCEQA